MSAISTSPRTNFTGLTKEPRRKELYDFVDGKLVLNLHPGQRQVMESPAKNVFMLAGSQGGKTSLGPFWLYQEICRRSIYPEYLEQLQGQFDMAQPEMWMEEAGDYFAISANYDLFEMKMLPEILKIIVGLFQAGTYHAGSRTIELVNRRTGRYGISATNREPWGRIILRSAKAGKAAKNSESIGVSSLESATVKAAWLDECGLDDYTIDTWDSIQARLRLNRGRVLGTTTLYNYGWLKSTVYDPWRAGDPNFEVIQFDSSINPAFPIDEYLYAKETMPQWKFEMRYQGRFSRPAGMIFYDFDETTGIIEPYTLPREVPVIIGVDPGGVNTALVWLAIHDENVIVFRESLEGGMSSRGHVAAAKEFAHFFTGSVKFVGGAKSEEQFRKDWTEAGAHVYEPPINDVESGIDKIIELMKRKRLKIFKNCYGLIDEIREYRRVVDVTGEPTEEIKDKKLFHRIDGLRYGVSVIRLDAGETFRTPKERVTLDRRNMKLPFGNKKIPRLR